MSEENVNLDPQVVGDNNMYLEQIKNMKKNSVSREEFEKLQNENRNLLKSLVEGNSGSSEQAATEKESILDLTNKLKSGELNNLDYMKTSLELRNRILEETGFDQYAGKNPNGVTSQEALASAQKVADSIQSMIDKSDGNSSVFTGYYQAEVQDPIILKRR